MNKNEHSIGKAIAKLRAEKGWTQARLAKELCVEDKTISRWECEEGYPSITSLPQIAKVFNVSIDYLLTGNESEQCVVYESKKELCAKNDDLELFESIDKDSLSTKDENGKTMLDYILTYFPQKVMKAYADKIYSTDMRLKLLLGTVDLPWSPSEKGKIGNYDNLLHYYYGLNVWGDYVKRLSIPESVYNEKLFDFIIVGFEHINKESLNLYLCQFPSVAEKLFAKAIDLLPSEKGENIIKYLFSFRDEYTRNVLRLPTIS
ncbi:MAG: helix-turn-helix transcriptional regulator [Ruminococcaceae bacterium]|nr:helix-turn-helix transcriptional regulator [Oscillospiraceae bacterium]